MIFKWVYVSGFLYGDCTNFFWYISVIGTNLSPVCTSVANARFDDFFNFEENHHTISFLTSLWEVSNLFFSLIFSEMLIELNNFKQWLKSFGGGTKGDSATNQMAKHVIAILTVIDSDFSEETIISKMNEIEQDFIPTMLTSKQSSTVKNYLLDFKKFVTWASMKNRPFLVKNTEKSIGLHINHWIQSLNKGIAARSHETRIEHGQGAIAIEHIQMYMNGKRATFARDIFDQAATDQAPEISMKFHTLTRNNIVMLLVLSNATRAGPIINMKLKDVKNAVTNIHNGRHVINVRRHKTEAKYGSAQLSLASLEFQRLLTYVEKIRPQVGIQQKIIIFLNYLSVCEG